MEEKINELKDRNWETMQAEKEREPRFLKNEKILWEIAPLKGQQKKMGVPEG